MQTNADTILPKANPWTSYMTQHPSLKPLHHPNASKGQKWSQVESALGSEQKQIPIFSGEKHPNLGLQYSLKVRSNKYEFTMK